MAPLDCEAKDEGDVMSVSGKTLGQLFGAAKGVAGKAVAWIWKAAQWGALGYVLWLMFDWLSNLKIGTEGPTQGESITAWVFKGIVGGFIALGVPLLAWGLIKNSPLQGWLLPLWDEIRDAAKLVRGKLDEGEKLDIADAIKLVAFAVISGLVMLGASVFAGLLALRM